jgi:hypothetical protein
MAAVVMMPVMVVTAVVMPVMTVMPPGMDAVVPPVSRMPVTMVMVMVMAPSVSPARFLHVAARSVHRLRRLLR